MIDWKSLKIESFKGVIYNNPPPVRKTDALSKAKYELRERINLCISNKERKKLIEEEIELNKK